MQWNGRTARGAALGLAALAVVAGGGIGAGVLTAGAASAPAAKSAVTRTAATVANEDQKATRGWVGLALADLNEKLAKRLGLTQTSGIVVVAVMPDSPAAKAGAQAKDLLVQVNGAAVTDLKTARTAIGGVKPGDTVQLTVQRGGQEQTLTITAAEAPVPTAPPFRGRPGMPGMPGMGLFGPHLKEMQGIPPGEMFSHLQSGSMTFTDKDGKPVTVTVTAGKVTAVTSNSVTVQPNGGGAAVTYTVGADTVVRGRTTELVQLKTDDPVVVMTVNGSAEARQIISPPELRKGAGRGEGHAPRGPRGPQAQFFGAPGGMGMAWLHAADPEDLDVDALFRAKGSPAESNKNMTITRAGAVPHRTVNMDAGIGLDVEFN